MEKITKKAVVEPTPALTPEVKVKSEVKPAEIALKVGSEESAAPAPAAKPEKVQTDVRAKLARKTDGENVFVPSNPPQLEAEAKVLAQNAGFDFNRGTSIGARLMARANQQFPK